jgi:hypothetical protein
VTSTPICSPQPDPTNEKDLHHRHHAGRSRTQQAEGQREPSVQADEADAYVLAVASGEDDHGD